MRTSTGRFHGPCPIRRIILMGVLLALALAALACGAASAPPPNPIEDPSAGGVSDTIEVEDSSGGCFAMAAVIALAAGMVSARRL